MTDNREVVIVSAARTPIGRFQGGLSIGARAGVGGGGGAGGGGAGRDRPGGGG